MIRTLIRKTNNVEAMIQDRLSFFHDTKVGKYWASIYEAPLKSEIVLGRFFFYKTTFTTAVAFYSESALSLALILGFATAFDALCGVYQHTIMNYCHRTYFQGKTMHAVENLFRRFSIDIVRAEVISFLAMGFSAFALTGQSHIIINRLGSGTYYFNAALLDKLVANGTFSRNFRTKYIIFASTLGGLLSTLDLAKTQLPSWTPNGAEQLFAMMPSPFYLLLAFNFIVFLFMAFLYLGFSPKKSVTL